MSRNKLYIAGPMTGLPENNYPAFEAAEIALLKEGFDVLSPHWNKGDEENPDNWIEFMYQGIELLLQCNSIYMLQGWEKSKGARIEFNLACDLKMKVLYQGDYRCCNHCFGSAGEYTHDKYTVHLVPCNEPGCVPWPR